MRSGTLLPMDLPLPPSCCQLPVAFAVNPLLASGQHILRRDIADGTVQADILFVTRETAPFYAPMSHRGSQKVFLLGGANSMIPVLADHPLTRTEKRPFLAGPRKI